MQTNGMVLFFFNHFSVVSVYPWYLIFFFNSVYFQYPELQASAMLALCRFMIIDADYW